MGTAATITNVRHKLTYLQEARKFGVSEGHMAGVGVSPRIDAHAQRCQGQVDALGF